MGRRVSIIQFQQAWFTLAAALESIKKEWQGVESFNFTMISQGVKVTPIKIHHKLPLGIAENSNPERVVEEFLGSRSFRQFSNVHFSRPFLPKENIPKELIDEIETWSIDDLKAFRISKMRIGMATFSHLVSVSRSSGPELSRYRNLIRACIETGLQIINFLDTFESRTDEFWVWNGRSLHERVVVEWCRKNSKRVQFLEMGGESETQGKWIRLDCSPHDRVEFQKRIQEFWQSQPLPLSSIEKWFSDQKGTEFNKFISKQRKGLVPGNMTATYFVFYTSSDDEVTAISEEWDSPWGDQILAVRSLISAFETLCSYHQNLQLIIRVHPNMLNKSKYDQARWVKLSSEFVGHSNITFIDASSSFDSYSLMGNAQGILVYGSTIGIEASFDERYVASLIHTRYDILCKIPILQSHEDIINWCLKVMSKQLERSCKEGALAWGNWALHAGEDWSLIERKANRGRVKLVEAGFVKPTMSVIALSRIYTFLINVFLTRKAEEITYLLGRGGGRAARVSTSLFIHKYVNLFRKIRF